MPFWYRFLCVVVILLAACPAAAQIPNFQIYFDQAYTVGSKDCPPGGGIDSLYVIAQNVNEFFVGAEYSINFPPSMTFLSDHDTPPVTFGNSDTGISMGFPIPQNGFMKVRLSTVRFMWNCSDCSSQDEMILVEPNNLTGGFLGVTRYPDYAMIDAIGMNSFSCPTIPTEETTWGRVKSVYGE